ncbi:MAG TPA: PrgI family protein, partial [Acidimicrobiia bacterium]|nr:PrgI family protein [Acidimicrobiia bacterium]
VVFPALAVEADGLVDLGRDGAALICRATTVNLALRSEAEQEALVAAFGRVLNGLAGPLQVVIHTEAVDLDDHVDRLVHAAPGLPHPGLESAAGDHARFLAGLAQQRDVWRRQIFLIVRERLPLAEAASTLHRRVEELGSLLAGAGVKLTVLDGGHVADLLLRHTRPDATPPAGLSLPDEIIRTAPG